jgi:ribonuclease HII
MEKYKNNKFDIGIDEAGRGPFCGPVYASSVIWYDSPEPIDIITDSKKLSKKKRRKAFDWINENIKVKGIGFSSEKEIDNLGIFNATKLAMERSVNDMVEKNQSFFNNLSDSSFTLTIDGIGWDKMNFKLSDKINISKIDPIIKGDSKFCNISAASILAKEYHDEAINEFCINNKEIANNYDLLNNKGYGTAKHIVGIKKYGLSDYHRKSFKINYT